MMMMMVNYHQKVLKCELNISGQKVMERGNKLQGLSKTLVRSYIFISANNKSKPVIYVV